MIVPEEFVDAWCFTGSSVICNPPVTDTDIDVVILANDPEEVKCFLEDEGWAICGSKEGYGNDSSFTAYRKGKDNYIIVEDQAEFDRWEAATLLAQKRNLLKKEDRIKLFSHIRAGTSHKDW